MLISEKLAQFIVETEYDSLPEDVVGLARERILDTLGAAVAGEASWDSRDMFLEVCQKFGKGDSGIWGNREFAVTPERAAMIHATYAHAAELDDGHRNAGCHAGAVVVPTALTLGKETGATGKEILTAVVIGYEIVYRIVAGMTPYQIQKGFHPSGNCDTFGAMAVAGKLMGLNARQIANGMGFAGLFASGLMEATVSGQRSKCVQVGNAALNGISAAYYAKAGMEGTITVFEGKTGFFHAQSQDVDVDAVCNGLGSTYLIGDTYSKLYPTCRHSQAAIEGVLDLAEEDGFEYDEVQAVWVGTHQLAVDLTGIIKEPKNSAEAKFSLAYGVALALREHSVGICHLTPEYWNDPINRELAARVTIVVDPEVQSFYPKKRGAKVEIRLKDGRTLKKELYDLKGSPDNPVGWKELEKKFVANLTGIYSPASIAVLIELIRNLEQWDNIQQIMDILYR